MEYPQRLVKSFAAFGQAILDRSRVVVTFPSKGTHIYRLGDGDSDRLVIFGGTRPGKHTKSDIENGSF